ncbi:MAG: response regulator [Candidatus Omnitrophica bacterium]|nr:response regulator [Candidatus Omnitrophota bacterium]
MNNIDYNRFWSPAFDSLEEFIFILDLDHGIKKVNKAFLKFTDKDESAFLNKKCYEVMHGKDEPISDCPYCALKDSKKYEKKEYWEPLFNKWFFVQTAPLFDDNKDLLGSIHLMSDITVYKRAEEAVIKAKKDLERIFKVVPSAVFTVNENKIVTGWNKKAEELTGYKAQEVIGKKCNMFSEYPCESFCGLYSNDVEKPIIETECSIKKKNGDRITILKNADILKNDEGKIIGGIESFSDITARRNAEKDLVNARDKLEQQSWGLQKTNESIKTLYKNLERKNFELKKLDQLKSDFVSTVSHELRTPLAISTECINLILDGVVGKINEEQKELLNASKDNLHRLHTIVNDLLDISKIESGEITLRKTIVDLKSTMNKITDDYQKVLDTKQQKIKTIFPDNEMFFFIDEEKIIQVVTNLLNNAHKFTPEGGEIELEIAGQGGGCLCRVSDTGVGIEKDNISKLFDKFTQFGRIHGPGIKGTGLGLTISKSLIDLHGGQIWAESEIGKGTNFFFTLPSKLKLKQTFDNDVEKIFTEARMKNKESVFIIARFFEMDMIRTKFGEAFANEIINIVFEILARLVSRTTDKYILYDQETIHIALADTDKKGGMILLDKIKSVVRERVAMMKDALGIKVKFGFVMHPRDGLNKNELQERALEECERKKKVLIVDDHPQIGRLLSSRLERRDIITEQVFDGEEALDYLKTKQVDLILLDIVMPNMNGYEVLGRLKQNSQLAIIPIIVLTDKHLSEVREECGELGEIPVIEKTGNINVVIDLIERLT